MSYQSCGALVLLRDEGSRVCESVFFYIDLLQVSTFHQVDSFFSEISNIDVKLMSDPKRTVTHIFEAILDLEGI
jgi:hypothetical protein